MSAEKKSDKISDVETIANAISKILKDAKFYPNLISQKNEGENKIFLKYKINQSTSQSSKLKELCTENLDFEIEQNKEQNFVDIKIKNYKDKHDIRHRSEKISTNSLKNFIIDMRQHINMSFNMTNKHRYNMRNLMILGCRH